MRGETPEKFIDRASAGTQLGGFLAAQGALGADTVVLGLLRGGIPVAAPVALHAGCELGALPVRKLGIPGQPEVAFGAVASYRGKQATYLEPRIHGTALARMGAEALDAVHLRMVADLESLAARFADHAPPLAGRRVVLCDDGLATGATMRAALKVVAMCNPAEVVVAVPVAPADLLDELLPHASAVLSLRTPRDFNAVGNHYEDFSQVDEQDVSDLLRRQAKGS